MPVCRGYLALGSNLGNRLGNLQDAVRRLAPALDVDAVSSLYESDPVGPPGQPPYFNAVCTGTTVLSPEDLLIRVKEIEWTLGRRPGLRWGPRPIDIDILALDDVTIASEMLTIPHPRIEERGFVLRPLADIAPDLSLASGQSARARAERAGDQGLRRIAGPEWLYTIAVQPPAMRPAFA